MALREYNKKRIDHWKRVSRTVRKTAFGNCYHSLLQHYYRFFIPPGQKILEIGSGQGRLLNSLQPKRGVGIDFCPDMVDISTEKFPDLEFICADAHSFSIDEKFDYIILSDLLNDVWDVQQILMNIQQACHNKTRIIINYFNNIWRIPLGMARKLKLAEQVMEQNWLSPADIRNLLNINGFEEITRKTYIGLPAPIPVISHLVNKYLIHVFPLNLMALTNFSVSRRVPSRSENPVSVSIIIAARNEAGHIDELLERTPKLGSKTEIIFVEGGSSDNTYQTIKQAITDRRLKNVFLYQQTGTGKGDAVRLGFQKASGDIVLILDADMTVAPEDLPRFVDALVSGSGEFINGVRLVYPMESEAMRFFNILGNKFFSYAFSWLLGQRIKDTLCGTKVMWRDDYIQLAENRHFFGDFDPFGDFDLIFGASKLNLKIIDMPIRYRARYYGDTNISRWSSGWLLLKMVIFASRRLKFI